MSSENCPTCHCPIGLGSCPGCCAAAHCEATCYEPEEPPEAERCCHFCGKEFTDFSDLGCEYCDTRCPGFGVMS